MKNDKRGKSLQTMSLQVLGAISAADAERFLMDCVNLPNPIDYPDNRRDFTRRLRRWRRLFTYSAEDLESERWAKREIDATTLERLVPLLRGGYRGSGMRRICVTGIGTSLSCAMRITTC